MRPSAVRKMEEGAIKAEVSKLYIDCKKANEDIRVGKEKDVRKGLKIRRNIARMLTVLHEMSFKR